MEEGRRTNLLPIHPMREQTIAEAKLNFSQYSHIKRENVLNNALDNQPRCIMEIEELHILMGIGLFQSTSKMDT